MSGLRCWPGALAYIVAPWERQQEHGTVVTVLRRAAAGERRTQRNGRWTESNCALCRAWLCDGPGGEFPCFIADECLRPIVPPPAADSNPTAAEKPQPVEAA